MATVRLAPFLQCVVALLVVYTVTAVSDDTDSKLPPAPRKLRARAVSAHVIKLKWRDPLGKKNKGKSTRFYSIRYSAAGNEDQHQFVQSDTARTRVGGLQPNTSYVFAVKTVAGRKASPWSKVLSVSTTPVEHRVVKRLRAEPLSATSIRLSWALPRHTNDTVAYAILWAELDEDRVERKSVVTNGSTSFVLDDLQPYRMYAFRVQSMLEEGPGGSTERVMARPFSARPAKAPRNLVLKVVNHTHTLVTWRPPPARQRNGPLGSYKIQYQRRGSRKGDVCNVSTAPDDKQFYLTDLEGGETYKVRVAATTSNGTGPFSKWQIVDIPSSNHTGRSSKRKMSESYTQGDDDDNKEADDEEETEEEDESRDDKTPAAPEKLRADDVRSTSVTLAWRQPSPHQCCPIVAHRIVSRNVNSSLPAGEIVAGPNPQYRVSFLQPDTLYGFNVTAYSIAGESEQSEEVIVHTLPAEPPAILSVSGAAVLRGSSVNLTCVVMSEPPPEVTWFGPGKNLPYSSGRGTNMLLHREEGVYVINLHKSSRDVTSHLLIDSVTLQQKGNYSCVAKNSAGSVRMPVALQVKVPPSIMDTAGAEVMDGQGAQLMCAVTGSPLPEVVWLSEETDTVFEEQRTEVKKLTPASPFVRSVLEEGETMRRSYLFLPVVTQRHHGNYTCLARSSAGANETHVFLKVRIPPPPAVADLQAVALSPNSVSVEWGRPQNYKYDVTGYRVTYRPREGGHSRSLETQSLKQDIYGLQPRTSYVITLTALTPQTQGQDSHVTVTTLTNEGLQPANVSAVAINSSMIQLDWAPPPHVHHVYIVGYNLYYRRENDTREETLFIEGSRNKQFLISLGREETYYLRIATVTSWGHEAGSQWIRIQKHPQELVPPPPPGKVKVHATTDAVRVTWSSPAGDTTTRRVPLTGFRVIYGPVDVPALVQSVDLKPTAEQFTIKGLNASTQYIIAMRAFNHYAMSEPAYIRATTKAIPPSTVTNATARALSSTEIHVHWLPPQRGVATRYQIRYWRPGKRDKQSAWFKTPTSNYVAGSLKPFSTYRFEIIPFADQVIGEGSVIFADTLSAQPTAPPQDVTLTTLNATRLMVLWRPPLDGTANGVITGYKIVMKRKGGPRVAKFSVDNSRLNYTFRNLESGSTYKVRMAVVNTIGTGPFTDWVFGQTSKIEMKPPEVPQALQIEAFSHSLAVSWSPPRDSGVPVLGYIVGHGRYIPEVYRVILPPATRNFVIVNIKPATEYIVSVRALNHWGESSPQFSKVMTKSAPPTVKLQVPVMLRVTSLSPSAMQLTWVDPATVKRPTPATPSTPSTAQPVANLSLPAEALTTLPPPYDGRVYLIRYSAISEEKYQYLNATETTVNVTGLEVATTYEFAVRTTIGSEQSGWSLPVVNTTHHTAPSSAPRAVTVMPHSAGSLLVNWTQPLHPNGNIHEYIVYYTATPSTDTKLWLVKTTKKKSLVLTDPVPHTSYYFRVQARNAAGYGPLSPPVVYSPPVDSRAAPSNVTVWNLHGNITAGVEVMWMRPEQPVDQITGYIVYYTQDLSLPDAAWLSKSERGSSSLILGLTHNATYLFKVRARYGSSLGPASDTAAFTTPPAQEGHGVEELELNLDHYEFETDYDGEHLPRESLASPHQLSVEVGYDHVNVTWEAPYNVSQSQASSRDADTPTSGVQPISYQLQMMGGEDKDQMVASRTVADTSATFTQLAEGTNYVVRVWTVRQDETSHPATLHFHTLLSAPPP